MNIFDVLTVGPIHHADPTSGYIAIYDEQADTARFFGPDRGPESLDGSERYVEVGSYKFPMEASMILAGVEKIHRLLAEELQRFRDPSAHPRKLDFRPLV